MGVALKLLLLLISLSALGDAAVPVPSIKLYPMEILELLQDLFPGHSQSSVSSQRFRRAPDVYDLEFGLPVGIRAGVRFNNKSRPLDGSTAFLTLDNMKQTLPFSKNVKTIQLDIRSTFSQDKQLEIFIKVAASYNGDYFGHRNQFKGEFFIERNFDGSHGWTTRIKSLNVFPKYLDLEFNDIEIYHDTNKLSCSPIIGILNNIGIELPKMSRIRLFSDLKNKLLEMSFKSSSNGGSCSIDFESIHKEHGLKLSFDFYPRGVKIKGNYKTGSVSGYLESGICDIKMNGRSYLQWNISKKAGRNLHVKGQYSVHGGSAAKGKFRLKISLEETKLQIKEDKWKFKPSIDITGVFSETHTHVRYTIQSMKEDTVLWTFYWDLEKKENEIKAISNLEVSPQSAIYKLMHSGMKNIHPDVRKLSKLWFNRTRSTEIYINKVGKKWRLKVENDVGGLFDVNIEGGNGWKIAAKLGEQLLQYHIEPNRNGANQWLGHNGARLLGLNAERFDGKNKNSFVMNSEIDYRPQQQDSAGLSLKYSSHLENKKRIEFIAKKHHQEVCNYALDSKLDSNPKESVLMLNDSLYFHQNNFLEKNLVTLHSDPNFNRFHEQKSNLGIRIGKDSEAVLAKGNVKKDDVDVLDFFLNTQSEPLEFRFSSQGSNTNLDTMGIKVTHKRGQYIELAYDSPYFRSFRINRVGDGNKRELVLNGRKIASIEIAMKEKLQEPIEEILKRTVGDIIDGIQKGYKNVMDYEKGMPVYLTLLWLHLTFELQVLSVGFYLETASDNYIRVLSPLFPLLIISDLQS